MSAGAPMAQTLPATRARAYIGSGRCDVAKRGNAVVEVNGRPEFLHPDSERLAAAVCGRLLLNIRSALDHESFRPAVLLVGVGW